MMLTFRQNHPYRIDCGDGLHVRFSTLQGAIDTACFIDAKWIVNEHAGIVIDPRSAYAAAV